MGFLLLNLPFYFPPKAYTHDFGLFASKSHKSDVFPYSKGFAPFDDSLIDDRPIIWVIWLPYGA